MLEKSLLFCLSGVLSVALPGVCHAQSDAPVVAKSPAKSQKAIKAGEAALSTKHADPRDIVACAKISLVQALEKARAACPGVAVQAELEGEISSGVRTVFFEVMIVSADGHLHEVKIDPESGAVQSTADVTAEPEEAAELVEFKSVLRHAELGLEGLLAKASAVVNGHPVKAALELENGQPICDVTIVNGRLLIAAELEARAGHVLELELTSKADEDSEAGAEANDSAKKDSAKKKGAKKSIGEPAKKSADQAASTKR